MSWYIFANRTLLLCKVAYRTWKWKCRECWKARVQPAVEKQHFQIAVSKNLPSCEEESLYMLSERSAYFQCRIKIQEEHQSSAIKSTFINIEKSVRLPLMALMFVSRKSKLYCTRERRRACLYRSGGGHDLKINQVIYVLFDNGALKTNFKLLPLSSCCFLKEDCYS